ncbi:hypothetical protein OIU77_002554 [Salix suchowensis]|uniref:Protein-S-isoprenylcysteine O-methyltransferase n=1 Tax=Salix suchowensis TaxID=1278906 RepID=A0ABQ9AYQ7_9ROSI|nr:hypothetical protein OIU77_002554 [Salix suchowensis]
MMSFLEQILGDMKNEVSGLMMYSCCPPFSEIFGYSACRQLSQIKAYVFAMMFALLEYVVEIALFPGLKEYWWISNLGLVMVIIGEITRKLAIVTAGQAFTHLIKVNHEDQHNLITHGVYRFVRHPSYTGFLIWSVGTQIMLCNPISTIGFAIVVWRFFAQRIPYEEFFLRQFFGSEYEEYA